MHGEKPEGFEAFAGADRVDRFLYLGDQRLKAVSDSSVLKLIIAAPDHGGRDLARLLEWEYWNGRRWRELRTMQVEVERGEVVFYGPQDLSATQVHGVEDFWVRGRLAEVPQNPWETEIDTAKAVIETAGEGVVPDIAFANLDGGVFLALDLGKNIFPHRPAAEDRPVPLPRVARDAVAAGRGGAHRDRAVGRDGGAGAGRVGRPDAVVGVLRRQEVARARQVGAEGDDSLAARIRGRSSTAPTASPRPASSASACRTDMHAGEVNGEDNFWVRARVELGDYGLPGSYMLDGDKWVWRDDRPLKPPSFKSVGFKYRADLQHVKHVLSYNDFRYRDHSDESKIEYRPFQPFSAVPDEGAALYLGWNGKLPNDPISLYVLLADVRAASSATDRADVEFLKNYYADRDAVWEAEQRVVWEYFDGTNWSPLVVIDGTKNFTVSGFVDFVGPDDHQKTMKFTEDRYWIRARLEMGGYVKPPRIAAHPDQHRRGGQRRHDPRRDPRLVRRHADPDLRLLAGPARSRAR